MECVNPINQPMVNCCLDRAAMSGDSYRSAAATLAAAEVSVFHCTRAQLKALTANFDIAPRITIEGFAVDYRFPYPKGQCRDAANQPLYDALTAQAKWCYRRPPNHHAQYEHFNEMAAQIMLLDGALVRQPNIYEFISAEGEVVRKFIQEFIVGGHPTIRDGGELSRFQFPPLRTVENEDLYNHLYCYAWNRREYWPAMAAVAACPELIHLNSSGELVPELPGLSDISRQQIIAALV
jgi:hypothetical protein